jgi:hypothetical protein
VQSALEFALFVVVYVIAITRSERRLMSELLGGLRGRATRADTLDPARELQ